MQSKLLGMDMGFGGPRFDLRALKLLSRLAMGLLLSAAVGLFFLVVLPGSSEVRLSLNELWPLLAQSILQEFAVRALLNASYFKVGF
jgi:hypothetical protein